MDREFAAILPLPRRAIPLRIATGVLDFRPGCDREIVTFGPRFADRAGHDFASRGNCGGQAPIEEQGKLLLGSPALIGTHLLPAQPQQNCDIVVVVARHADLDLEMPG